MEKKRTRRIFPALSLLFLSLLLLPAAARALTPEGNLKRLTIRQAAVKSAAWKDSYWRKLLYYKKTIFGRDRSLSGNPQFFLAKWGNINPRLELEAAIDGLFFEGAPDDSPECRFPERYRWLREQFGLPVSAFPRPQCGNFEEWKAGLDPESVSFVFAAGSLNLQSAPYGYTFLRLHKRGEQGAELSDSIISFALTPEDEPAIPFALKGLMGPSQGQFSTLPYSLKLKQALENENRDVWEFPLNLSQDETDKLLRRTWELGKASFPYHLFTRNSAWQQMELLNIIRPEMELSRRLTFWVLPSDTAKAILSASPEAAPVWHTPLWKSIAWKRSQLSRGEQASVLKLSLGDQTAELKKLDFMDPRHRSAVLEASEDYLRWRFNAHRIGKSELEGRRAQLLQPPAAPGQASFFAAEPAPPSLREAHESLRVGAGLVALKSGSAYEVQVRSNLQDLLDDPAGYQRDSALETGSIKFRYEKRYNRFYLKEGILAHFTSLNPWDDWTRSRSWDLSAGIQQADETGRQSGRSAIWAMNAASGYSYEWAGPVRQLWYAMAQADSGFGPSLNANWRAGAGIKVGFLAEKGPVRALFEARYTGYVIGDTRPLWAGSAAASLRLAKDSSARLEYAWRGEVKEAGLYFHQFFSAP